MSKKKKDRMKAINQMLFEMASGNFFYRLERSGENDNIEALTIIINMLAEEIQGFFLHQGYVHTNGTIKNIVQMSFVLDTKGRVQMINKKTCTILCMLSFDILGKPFHTLLAKDSVTKWLRLWKTFQNRDFYDTSLELDFRTPRKHLVPSCCYITSFTDRTSGARNILVNIIHHSKGQNGYKKGINHDVTEFNKGGQLSPKPKIEFPKNRPRLSSLDIRKLREARDIIINNLEKELPPLRDFAIQLGTNEFKLKYGFKEMYGTSVHRFLVHERLRKAKMLVQHTDISLKSVALMTGFKSFPHFSRIFKKEYGDAPSIQRKQSLNTEK